MRRGRVENAGNPRRFCLLRCARTGGAGACGARARAWTDRRDARTAVDAASSVKLSPPKQKKKPRTRDSSGVRNLRTRFVDGGALNWAMTRWDFLAD